MGDLADRVRDLEDEYAEQVKDNIQLEEAYENLKDGYAGLQRDYSEIEAELEWYRSTFPEGSDSYA